MIYLLGAAAFIATLFFVFKSFDRRHVATFPAIIINYFVAFATGCIIFPISLEALTATILIPAIILGFAFISMFTLTAVSVQRVGVSATTISSKMSLVLTVLISMYLYEGTPGDLQLIGIALAIASVVLASWKPLNGRGRDIWVFPLILFLSNAFIDSFINHTQEVWLDPASMEVFPSIVFFIAGAFGLIAIIFKGDTAPFKKHDTWIGGLVLGVLNFASLYFMVKSLADSGMAASSVFPIVNMGVVLFATLGALVLFKERISKINWVGLVAGIGAMLLILFSDQAQ